MPPAKRKSRTARKPERSKATRKPKLQIAPETVGRERLGVMRQLLSPRPPRAARAERPSAGHAEVVRGWRPGPAERGPLSRKREGTVGRGRDSRPRRHLARADAGLERTSSKKMPNSVFAIGLVVPRSNESVAFGATPATCLAETAAVKSKATARKRSAMVVADAMKAASEQFQRARAKARLRRAANAAERGDTPPSRETRPLETPLQRTRQPWAPSNGPRARRELQRGRARVGRKRCAQVCASPPARRVARATGPPCEGVGAEGAGAPLGGGGEVGAVRRGARARPRDSPTSVASDRRRVRLCTAFFGRINDRDGESDDGLAGGPRAVRAPPTARFLRAGAAPRRSLRGVFARAAGRLSSSGLRCGGLGRQASPTSRSPPCSGTFRLRSGRGADGCLEAALRGWEPATGGGGDP